MINMNFEQLEGMAIVNPTSSTKLTVRKAISNSEGFKTILAKMEYAVTVEEQKQVWEELIEYVKNQPLDPNNCEEVEVFFFTPQEKTVDNDSKDV